MHVKRREKILKAAKGFRWGRRKLIKAAKVAVVKAGRHAYFDRRKKKQNARRLWTIKINAAVRPLGLSYSKFINLLLKNKIELDRKVLAEMAEKHNAAFVKLVESLKK